jgi:cytochrome c553
MKSMRRNGDRLTFVACVGLTLCGQSLVFAQDIGPLPPEVKSAISHYCVSCHDADAKKSSLDLERLLDDEVALHPREWEQVVRKLRARQMPPANRKQRPDEATYEAMLLRLEVALDAAALADIHPGRTETLRRLNRTEYQNAIRDLLALDIDAAALLPRDDAGHGFDNVNVGTLSPTLLDRYITAALKISRLAVGNVQRVGGDTFRTPPDFSQEQHVQGLPFGTRGGLLIPYAFPQDAEYEVQIRLTRDRNDEVEGLRERHEVQVLLDREVAASFFVEPPRDRSFDAVDRHLKARIPVKAGPHQVGVTFVKDPTSLIEWKRQPYNVHFNMHRHPRVGPAIYQVSINGPYDPKGPGDTPSRRRIFATKPRMPDEEETCAKQILLSLARRAYRRPVSEEDIERPLALYREARQERDFEAGIESGLSAILVSPNFLFRVERDPEGVAASTAYRISDLELASRLSFFLWSSLPDDDLLAVAERGDLHKPPVLEEQTRRLLADPRARSLASNFAGQWLHLRNLDSFTPDLRLFPDFDDNLRQALRQETELFFAHLVREDRSALELLKADYTFLNERLAKHYGAPGVHGSRFRRVSAAESGRGGLLRHGSVLAVTSYATRTSPVLRGKWVLENLIGTPPPPPLPDVPALDNVVAANLSVRERLAQHRANTACASCHNLIDPPGFALENYDAVGRWRDLEEGKPVDASGGLPDGSQLTGIAGLEDGLLQRPELFAGTLTEKLLTFALGRGVEHFDAHAVRRIVREAKATGYKFSSIIVGITKSAPFTMRRTAP